MSELKACPWGHPAKFDPKDGPCGSVTCSSPGCPVIGHLDPKEWNRRADDAGRLKAGVVGEIAAERERQKSVEGWTPKHDDAHGPAVLSRAAAAYCLGGVRPSIWPWDWKWWKPTTHRRDLIKAAALIVAEIDRIDRASLPASPSAEPRLTGRECRICAGKMVDFNAHYDRCFSCNAPEPRPAEKLTGMEQK